MIHLRTFLFLSALLVLITPIHSSEKDVIGELVLVEGGVTLKTGSESLPLEAGEALAEGDEIHTDGSGTVEVSLGDRNQFVLSPGSKLKVLSASHGKGLLLELDQGLIRAKLDNWKKEEIFNIRTPSAVAGVRGTDFAVEIGSDKNAEFDLDVIEGSVQIDSKGVKGERVEAGKGLRLGRRGNLKERREAIREKIREAMKNRMKFREALKTKWAKRTRTALQSKFKGFDRGERLKNLKAKAQNRRDNIRETTQERRGSSQGRSGDNSSRNSIRERSQDRTRGRN